MNISRGPHIILVVDDEPDALFLFKIILERAGYRVIEAKHGREAIDRIEEALPDVIVTDLMMPVMDGRALLAHVRADARAANVPIVVVSANPTPIAGADEVLGKPFQPEEIVLAVQSAIRQQAVKGA